MMSDDDFDATMQRWVLNAILLFVSFVAVAICQGISPGPIKAWFAFVAIGFGVAVPLRILVRWVLEK